jgi:Protein of unknown function (DUF2934)
MPIPTQRATGREARRAERALPTGDLDLSERRREQIAARAYARYEARGGEHGLDLGDWLEAEREVDSALDQLEEQDEQG